MLVAKIVVFWCFLYAFWRVTRTEENDILIYIYTLYSLLVFPSADIFKWFRGELDPETFQSLPTTRWSTPWNSWLIQMLNAWCRIMTSNASHLCIVQLYKVKWGKNTYRRVFLLCNSKDVRTGRASFFAECGRIRLYTKFYLYTYTQKIRIVLSVGTTMRCVFIIFPKATVVTDFLLCLQVELIWWNSFWKQGLM